MISYVFDVDGTLSLHCQEMSTLHRRAFIKWMDGKRVYILTGSDKDKTVSQVGIDLWSKTTAYQCCGNDIYSAGNKVYESQWPLGEDSLIADLENCCEISKYYKRCGNHIEIRKGMINYSTIGRNCSQSEREEYFEWDKKVGERLAFQKLMAQLHPDLEVTIGGQISVDIYPKGKNKGQVFDWLKNEGPIYFFGDRTEEGGNDYPLAKKIIDSGEPNRLYTVTHPRETLNILRDLT